VGLDYCGELQRSVSLSAFGLVYFGEVEPYV
jgi:hypothetical protein